MNDERSDSRKGGREVVAGTPGAGGPHLGSKRLIAYHQGALSAAERARVQEHLSLCPRCTGLLRELREFEAAAAGRDPGPETLRRQAWDALVDRLPAKAPVVRPLAGLPRRQARPRWALPLFVAAAGLVLAAIGLTAWTAVTLARERQRLTQLEERLEQRQAALAAARRSLAATRRQLAAARGRIDDLERNRGARVAERPPDREEELAARVAELTAALAEARRPRPDERWAVAAADGIEVSVAPRYVLRGRPAPDGGRLRAGGAVNTVRAADGEGRFTVALNLPGHPVPGEVRLELLDRDGRLLWAGRRPGRALAGDAGTSLTIGGLAPGRYRLRIEAVRAAGGDLLAEYLLEVAPAR